MFGRAIWDKFPECILENCEISRVKRGQFPNFQKTTRQKSREPNVISG